MLSWLLNLGRTVLGAITHLFANGDPYVPVPTLEESCVAHYKMNDNAASTVVLDSSGNGYHGESVRNTEDMHVDGIGGGALEFDGVSDYVDTNDSFQSVFKDSFTINMKVNVFGDATLFGVTQTDKVHFTLSGEDQWIILEYRAGGVSVILQSDDGTFGEFVPFIVTAVFKKLTASTIDLLIYKDGVLIKQKGSSSVNMSDYSGTGNPYIGCRNSNEGAEEFYTGLIDNVMIFNKALNQEEIWTLYNAGRGTEDFQLTPNLNFDGSALIMEGI